MNLTQIEDKVLSGGDVTRDEALFLADFDDIDALCDSANRIRKHFQGDNVDSCSIVNARSGMCGEDCKWCAQATKYATGCDTYNFIDEAEVMHAAFRNQKEGIKRLSLVTSGRAVSKSDLEQFCKVYKKLSQETNLYLCASMGLLDYERMQMLRDAGVRRYHCNMETSEEFFSTLCSSHSPQDKKNTIAAAKKAGLDVCSGGIIGMGESMQQRIDFAFELKNLDVVSVPINILNPIPGTPLENVDPISEDEIIRTAAIMRFVLPKQSIRFAGGRMRLSHKSMLRMMRGGVNGVLMGDMLTTIGNKIAEDRDLFNEAGLVF